MQRPDLPPAPPEQTQLGAMHYLILLDLSARAVPINGSAQGALRCIYDLVHHQPSYASLALGELVGGTGDGQTHAMVALATQEGTDAALDFFEKCTFKLNPSSEDPEELLLNYRTFVAECLADQLKNPGLTGFLRLCASIPDFRRRWAPSLPENYLLPYLTEN